MLQLSSNVFNEEKVSENLNKIIKGLTTIAYFLNSHIFDEIINECEKYKIEVDTYYANIIQIRGNSYCINPQIVQHPKGLSDIS